MALIDDEGRLLGAVNVIDALVVLLVLAVVVAGIALVNPLGDDRETATRYATLYLGDQPDYVAERVSPGDTMRLRDSPGEMTVTDVYVGPGPNRNTSAYVRVRLNGTMTQGTGGQPATFQFAGEPVRSGTVLDLQTDEYDANGIITRVSESNASLLTTETKVTVETTVPTSTANAIDPGDTYTLAGHPIGTVEAVSTTPVDNPNQRRVTLGLRLSTIRDGNTTHFGNRPITVDQPIPFGTGEYGFEAPIIQTGSYTITNDRTPTTVVVKAANVTPEIADAIRTGMTEGDTDPPTARITDKRVEPAVVILTSEDGNIYQREHPRNKDVYLTIQLQARSTASGLQFHGSRLQVGTSVIFDFGPVTVNGQVVELRPE